MRNEKTRVKTAKGRKLSSTLWLKRQLNDPYVQRAKAEGFRSRAAYKLLEIDEKFKLLKAGAAVVDLGAAPGGWTQVAAQKQCRVVALDVLAMPPVPGASLLQMDFADDAAPQAIKAALGGKADVVLSDMAPNTIGHAATDHLRIMALVELAFAFACDVLEEGGSFAAKTWQGGAEAGVLAEIKRRFRSVRHVKPKASRADSAEMYIVAQGFRAGEA